MFVISPDKVQHLNRHFAGSKVPGSHFNTDVFPTIDSLIEYINKHEPYTIIQQSATKKAYLFMHEEGIEVGTCGIAKRDSLPTNDIITEQRDGFSIEIGLVKELPKSNEFCVIATDTIDGKMVLTAFPGMFAPPFPEAEKNEGDYLKSKYFWQKYILIKIAHP